MAQEHTIVSHPKKSNQNLVAVVIYLLDIMGLLGSIVSLIILIFAKKNQFIRFHAAQSLITFLAVYILGYAFYYVPFIGRTLQALIAIGELVLLIFLMIKAYQNIKYKLPYIGDLAEGLLKKIG